MLAPTEIARQIFTRDAVERAQPALAAAHVTVDVLDVKALADVLAAAGDDGHMPDLLGLREGDVGIATVADEYCILGNDRCEIGGKRLGLEIWA